MDNQIKTMLDALTQLHQERTTLLARLEAERAMMIPDWLKEQLSVLDALVMPQINSLTLEATQLTEHIKAAVLDLGRTVSNGTLEAVYNKGRVTWNSPYLQGYAAAHPEILSARTQGQPNVTIRQKH